MRKRISVLIFFIFFMSCFAACGDNKADSNGVPKNASVIEDAEKAYVFGFPAVLMHLNEKVMTNPVKGSGNVPLNRFRHTGYAGGGKAAKNIFPDADFLHSAAWIEVVRQPLVLEIPEIKGRYAVFSVMDAWSNIIISLGIRTTGTTAQKYLITPPDWTGAIPDDTVQIKSPTNMVFISGKIQVHDSGDAKNAAAVQKKLKLTPLERYGDKTYKPADVDVDKSINMAPPLEQLFNMHVADYFNLLNSLMSDNPPYDIDKEFLDGVKYLKIAPGEEFDLSIFDEDKQNELKAVPERVEKWFEENFSKPGNFNGWIHLPSAKSSPDTNYEKRALNVYKGIGIELPEDVLKMQCFTDSDNEELYGKNKYILHFDKDSVPSDELFWSLTAYNDEFLFIDNPLNRYSVNNKKTLKHNDDGSLDIYIQNGSPGKSKESNWLPVSKERFNLVFKACYAGDDITVGNWAPPAVKKK